MTKDETKIKDWRSTGRRKARRALYEAMVPYRCAGFDKGAEHFSCGKTTIKPPEDAPKWFDEIWPEDNRTLESQLQADHKSKDLTNNNIDHLDWRCPSCHRYQDQQTEKGQAQSTVDFWGTGPTPTINDGHYW